jgi:hypothetical protein
MGIEAVGGAGGSRPGERSESRHGARGLAALVLALLVMVPRDALATDPFEIQVYDGTANPPGVFGLELHLNTFIRGLRDPSLNAAPEIPLDRQTHFTFEPSIGVTDWWELGAYLQTALLPDSTLHYGGVKLRTKFVSPPRFSKSLRFGLNLELSLLPEEFDRSKWGGEIRPIIAWETPWSELVLNANVDGALAHPDAQEGPTFQPAAMALVKWEKRASMGLEYYGNIGPFVHPLPARQQEQYLFEVANVLAVPRLELNLGCGEGLTDGSAVFVAKGIIGYTWEK